jgi:hypothetical protein
MIHNTLIIPMQATFGSHTVEGGSRNERTLANHPSWDGCRSSASFVSAAAAMLYFWYTLACPLAAILRLAKRTSGSRFPALMLSNTLVGVSEPMKAELTDETRL